MILDWVSFLAYPNLFGIKCFVVFVVLLYYCSFSSERAYVKIKILLGQLGPGSISF
jgi:hypothetical protein